MDMTRDQYAMLHIFHTLLPAVISAVLMLILPQKYAKPLMKTVFLLIVLWYGIIVPTRLMFRSFGLFHDYVGGTGIIQLLKESHFRTSLLSTIAISFCNALVKAVIALVSMALCLGIKRRFSKKNE